MHVQVDGVRPRVPLVQCEIGAGTMRAWTSLVKLSLGCTMLVSRCPGFDTP